MNPALRQYLEPSPSPAERACGVLLHMTSLPGGFGCGDLGGARRFLDYLHAAGVRWWMMLPVHPVDRSGCPYKTSSVFAASPLMIDLDDLVEQGLLDRATVRRAAARARREGAARSRRASAARGDSSDRSDYAAAGAMRMPLLREAFREFRASGLCDRLDYVHFVRSQPWVDDFAAFAALKRAHGGRAWTSWPRAARRMTPADRERLTESLGEAFEFSRFCQFILDEQWGRLRDEASRRGVALLGDIPFFVAHDSADVWASPELFELDRKGLPRTVSGVPPDLFNRRGQRWGHPQYRWRTHVETGFAWWVARFGRSLEMFDAVRLDHFIGLHRLWSIPAADRDARRGRWIRTPGEELLSALRNRFGELPVVAEDLGVLTRRAAELRDAFGFPGMRVLQFGFGDESAGSRYHRPEGYPRKCVGFTGTHDNDTLKGWLESLPEATFERVRRYAGVGRSGVHEALIRRLLESEADLVMLPMQDVLRLGGDARMNRPGVARGNWRWRLSARQLSESSARRLRERIEESRRLVHNS
ncbi:MAG: 4-alpha-glucanotransferase [Phycisphaerae bacterium]|nr:MAG: 4-alpha-glucanotransferase [Planctomycetota bacterium]KAB2941504.1 MAG: 4-alpha-glucanotransferase [Phycisphaerae bacterium]MBE7458900.1 4-alpha-glucanotransferase [Planctomycetia bacterium]MCK6466155.1 4-alpha-glucanotransferase [Phycisphaerae bacterium]MCL4720168.1 4-alpha-glucanotransferase [Phycisphaerae bacterium]